MNYFDLYRIETAFFNHDSEGESCNGEWEQRRKEWASFRSYLKNDLNYEIIRDEELTNE